MSRDNPRTPMQWTDGANAGFTEGQPWIDVNPNHKHINTEADRSAEKSVFRYYQDLIRLRHSQAVVVLGDFHLEAPEDPHLFAYRRRLDGTEWLVLANVSGEDLEVPLGLASDGLRILGNYTDPGDPDVLRPWEVRVADLTGA